jgi:spore maturation protein CgeB
VSAAGLPTRVLLIGSHCAADSMEWHVRATLQELGVAVQFFEAVPPFSGSHSVVRKVVQKLSSVMLREPELFFEKALERSVQEFSPSLILVIMGNQLSPKTIARLRLHTRAPIVCWCQDQMTTLGRQYLLGAEYDAVFVKDRYLQDLFSRMIGSSSFHYLPEACNPQVHRTVALSSEQREQYACDVMIAGSLYYYRQEILQLLGEFDLKVWGRTPDWLIYRLPRSHMGRELVCDEKARAARAARIALNTLHYAEVDSLNCRAFELAGCGAFQLCTSKPVLAEHFRPGVEIETFASAAELVEKIRHYLRNPEQAAAIAHRGQERAHREHTYAQRLQQLFSVVGKSFRVA